MDLEELTNKQLRQKCMEYGLPNVPITDTNRKLLIKRLNNAMNGTAPKKPSTPKTTTPSNRRKTVHTNITTTVSSGDEDDFVIKTQRPANADVRRRQTVAPVAKASPPKPKPSAPRHVTERIIPIGFDSVANSTRISDASGGNANANNDRLRRSVSLTKTGVLTTSYSTETTKVPLRTTYEQGMGEDDYDEQEDDLDDIEMENVEKEEASKVFTHPSYGGYNQAATNFTTNPFVSPNFAMPAPPPVQTSANKLYPDLHSTGLQSDYYNSFDGMRASHSSSARHTTLGFTHNAPTSYMPSSPPVNSSSLNRHTITAGSSGYGGSPSILGQAPIYQSNLPTSRGTKRYTTSGITKRHTARAVDNDDLAASSSDGEYEPSYLSKFSRNLENLKPEPIYKRTGTTPAYTSVMKRRRGAYDEEESNTLSQLWATLEHKYHLKTAFYFVLLFVIAVFIYVFFLQ